MRLRRVWKLTQHSMQIAPRPAWLPPAPLQCLHSWIWNRHQIVLVAVCGRGQKNVWKPFLEPVCFLVPNQPRGLCEATLYTGQFPYQQAEQNQKSFQRLCPAGLIWPVVQGQWRLFRPWHHYFPLVAVLFFKASCWRYITLIDWSLLLLFQSQAEFPIT